MGIRYKDVEMLGDAMDSFGRSQVELKARRQRERDIEDRKSMEREALNFRRDQEANQTNYQNQNLALQREGITAQAQRYKNQGEREDRLDKAYEARTSLEDSKSKAAGAKAARTEASEKFTKFMDWMADGVRYKIMPADKANAQIKSALSKLTPEQKAELGDNPWLHTDGDFFKEQPILPSERVVDPDSGEIIYKENGQMVRGGVDPYTKEKAQNAAMVRLAQEAKGITPESAPAPTPTPAAPTVDPKAAEVEAYIQKRKALGGAPAVPASAPSSAPAPVQTPAKAPSAPAQVPHGVAKPKNAAEFNRLPRGVYFVNPADGKIYQKK